jgi:hypothetical protein
LQWIEEIINRGWKYRVVTVAMSIIMTIIMTFIMNIVMNIVMALAGEGRRRREGHGLGRRGERETGRSYSM